MARPLPFLKRSLALLAVFIVLFFLFDDIIMPRYVQQGETTYVPDVVGMETEAALRVLEGAGLEGKEAEIRPDKTYPEGAVAMQIPPAGSEVKFGRGVYLTVSGGETLVRVPALRGRSVRDATLALEQIGLEIGEITYQISTRFPENTVIDQSIAEGTNVKGGSAVNVTASQGVSADRIPVPDVTRKSMTEAERILLQSGLTPGAITYQVNNDFLPNTVIDQFPRSGAFIARGEPVQLFVTQRSDRQETPFEN